MVDLVGGVVCSRTGFVLPPLLYMRLRTRVLEMKRAVERTARHGGGAEGGEVDGDGGEGDGGEVANSTPSVVGHLAIVVFGLTTMVVTTVTNIISLRGGGG